MKNQEKPYVHKRIIAYLIDILIISVVSSLISMVLPQNDAYDKALEEMQTLRTQYTNKEIEQKEYLKEYQELNYTVSINTVDSSIIVIALSLLYFVVFNNFNHGQTLGKKWMKLQIVSANDNELHINNYLVRSLIANSILANIVSIVMLLTMNKQSYININDKVSLGFSILYVVCIILVLYRNDGRGLHDLLGGTKVINYKNEVNEALVINEKIEGSEKNA